MARKNDPAVWVNTSAEDPPKLLELEIYDILPRYENNNIM